MITPTTGSRDAHAAERNIAPIIEEKSGVIHIAVGMPKLIAMRVPPRSGDSVPCATVTPNAIRVGRGRIEIVDASLR